MINCLHFLLFVLLVQEDHQHPTTAHVMSCDAYHTIISLALLVVLGCPRDQVVQVYPIRSHYGQKNYILLSNRQPYPGVPTVSQAITWINIYWWKMYIIFMNKMF